MKISNIKLFDHRKIQDKRMRISETEDFWERAMYYPRINWEKWGIEPSQEWLERYRELSASS